MRLSTLATYALKAMVDLALHEGQGPIPVAAIARRQGIPPLTLAQLLHRLRRAGLVKAARGARGGYQLAKSLVEVSVADILHPFEGVLDHRPLRRPGHLLEAEGAVDQATNLVWSRLEVAVGTTLATTTLAELAAEARRRHTNHTFRHTYTFHI